MAEPRKNARQGPAGPSQAPKATQGSGSGRPVRLLPYQAISCVPHLVDEVLNSVPCVCGMINSQKSISCLTTCSPDSKNCELHNFPNGQPIGQVYNPQSNSYRMLHSVKCEYREKEPRCSSIKGCDQHSFSSKKYFPQKEESKAKNVSDPNNPDCTCASSDPLRVTPCPVHFPILSRPCSNAGGPCSSRPQRHCLPIECKQVPFWRADPYKAALSPSPRHSCTENPACPRNSCTRLDPLRCRPDPPQHPDPIRTVSCILAELPSHNRCLCGIRGLAGCSSSRQCPLHNVPTCSVAETPVLKPKPKPCSCGKHQMGRVRCPRHDLPLQCSKYGEDKERPCLCPLKERLEKRPCPVHDRPLPKMSGGGPPPCGGRKNCFASPSDPDF